MATPAKPQPELPPAVIFISSTDEDLKPYRSAAEEGARKARCLAETHDLWAAQDNPPLNESLARVAASDALVVIVAHRYGWVPTDAPGDGLKSITWLECERAERGGKEVLAFVVDEKAAWPEEAKEEYALIRAVREGRLSPELGAQVQRNVEQLRAFKAWLRGRGIQNTFVSPEDLQGKVAVALYEWKQRHPIFEDGSPPAVPRDPVPYLEALRDETGFIEIRGLQAGVGKAHRFRIDDLYTPLMDELGRPVDRPQAVSLGSAQGDRQGLDQALAAETRLVITGDPGSGKSTFLRWIIHSLCEARLGGRQDGAFPILLRVSDLTDFLDKAPAHGDRPQSAMWIVRCLGAQCGLQGLDEEFFLRTLREGPCLLALDGLDEAPSAAVRERLARMVDDAARNWPNTRIVMTTRPQAYEGEAVLPRFTDARIGGLDKEAVRTFLRRWSEALFPESEEAAARHAGELVSAVESRAEIRRAAQSPVMLTALAVLHWNEKRLPEQRADLYESILTWLSRSRQQRPGRPAPERCIALLQELARAMQEHPDGRKVQAPREWAAGVLAPRFREIADPGEQRQRAEKFLAEEELDSGIIVRRGNEVRFWHLTFQEHLAARALAAEPDWPMLFAAGRAWRPEWREVVLLLAGLLHAQRVERVDALVSSVLDAAEGAGFGAKLARWLGATPSLTDQARWFGLLGAMMRDLGAVKYQPADARYQQLLREVMGIFDAERSATVPLKVRVAAAEALGQADPRLRAHNWVRIPAGSFVMGESVQAHEVELDAYEIGRYPVTVEEYGRYVEEGGPEPLNWEKQVEYPNRPVVSVSWEDAAGYCGWAGVRLPTEAERERAARGEEGRPYPWGSEEPNGERANYDETGIGAATPVGLFGKGATPEGIYDLAGNVWEWVSDWYGDYPKGEQRNPTGPKEGTRRVVRGGAWYNFATSLRAALRGTSAPGARNDVTGFRCVREINFP
jgi:formylglycine-generating enzyme required for sulfatase activity